MASYVEIGQMSERVTLVTPPGASTSTSNAFGQVTQTGTGTDGSTVWARFRVLGIEDTLRAGGEAAADMAEADIHYTTEATERKRLRRELDSTTWDITKAVRDAYGHGFMRLTLQRTK